MSKTIKVHEYMSTKAVTFILKEHVSAVTPLYSKEDKQFSGCCVHLISGKSIEVFDNALDVIAGLDW